MILSIIFGCSSCLLLNILYELKPHSFDGIRNINEQTHLNELEYSQRIQLSLFPQFPVLMKLKIRNQC